MSHIICPKCGTTINLFGASRAEATAGMIGTTLIGHIPIDTQLSVLCDGGAIEEYRGNEFEEIVEGMMQHAPLKVGEPVMDDSQY